MNLFPGRVEGKPIVKVNAAHNAALNRSGVAKFRLYDLRHTWATRAAESGVDLVTLAAMLGHSKILMVTRYPHPSEQHQAAAMKGCSSTRLQCRRSNNSISRPGSQQCGPLPFPNRARRLHNWSHYASTNDHCLSVSYCVSRW